MAKKIDPKDYKKKLSAAHWDLLQRNDKAKKEYNESEEIRSFREMWESKRKEEAGLLQSDPERKAYYEKYGILPTGNVDDFLKESMCLPAVTEADTTLSWTKVLFKKSRQIVESNYDYKVMNFLWFKQILKDAKFILSLLIPTQMPEETLIVSINLTYPSETILAEFKDILSKKKAYLAKEKPEKHRLKWLPIIDDILAVWDLWVERGEPARQAFPAISKKLNVPESTVKARWYRAHVLIYGKPYENDPVKRREQRADKALVELCLKCTNPICGNKHGGDEIGCPVYEKMAGKNPPREQGYENLDQIIKQQSYESYLDPEEYDDHKDE